jgi:hypothetical protein
LGKGRKRRLPADVADVVFHGFHAAELDSRGAGGGFSAHSCTDLVLDGRVQELSEFGIQFLFDSFLLKQTMESAEQAFEPDHDNSPTDA